jgi:hypothetical protein
MPIIKVRIGKNSQRRLSIMRWANMACREYEGKVVELQTLIEVTKQYMARYGSSVKDGEIESCLILLLGLDPQYPDD